MPGTAFAGPNTGATPTVTDTTVTPTVTDTTVTPTVTTPAPRVGTTTAITGTTQASSPQGTTLTVSVSVTAASGTTAPTGSVKVTAGPGSCFVTLAQGSSETSAGSCPVSNLAGGYYKLTATYEGSAGFTGSSTTGSVTIAQPSQAPYFVAASPPLSATVGQVYAYTFHAKGVPAPTYALQGAPGWLHINSYSGAVWGTVPWWVNKFSYAVTASNSSSSATAGPYTVWVRHGNVAVSTSLSCPGKVHTGQKSSCTLYVTNNGSSPAPGVTAQIALPSPLRAKYCGFTWNWNVGCSISDNTAYMNLGTIYPGQTDQLTVVFVARSGFSLWGMHPGHRFTVKVVGSAASHGFWWIPGPRVSFSVAYITIIPWGHWW